MATCKANPPGGKIIGLSPQPSNPGLVKQMKDKVYASPIENIESFKFDDNVADVFENMIKRSVPGYELLLDVIGVLTQKYARPGTHCYDLGCSLGASTLQIRRHLPHPDCRIIAIDNSEAMVKRCRNAIKRDHSETEVAVRQENILDTQFENASLVTLNFTLQFIDDDQRLGLLKRIANGLVKGGILILSEKITFDEKDKDAKDDQQLMTALHEEFKKLNGYSDLEIAQKRTSLENVLVPNTVQRHFERLKTAGFEKTLQCVQCFNFVSILAIK